MLSNNVTKINIEYLHAWLFKDVFKLLIVFIFSCYVLHIFKKKQQHMTRVRYFTGS